MIHLSASPSLDRWIEGKRAVLITLHHDGTVARFTSVISQGKRVA